MRNHGYVLLLLVFSIAGCYRRGVRFDDLPDLDTSTPIERDGFAFMSPDEPGWRMVPSGPGTALLAKHDPSDADATEAIMAGFLGQSSPVSSDEDFVRGVRKALDADRDPRRFVDYEIEVVVAPRRGARCVRAHEKTLDTYATGGGGVKMSLTLQSISLVCVHPEDASAFVILQYSKRYHAPNHAPGREGRVEELFDSLAFRSLNRDGVR